MRAFAGRLLACEAARGNGPAPGLPAVFSACGRLPPPLATLIGKGGFHTLLSRVLALAGAEAPELRTVRIEADGSLQRARAEETAGEGRSSETGEEGLVLLAHLLGLLEAFIGGELTLQVVRGVWPELPPGGMNLENENVKDEQFK